MDTSFKGHLCSHFFPLWLHWASCDLSEYFLPSRCFLCPLIDQTILMFETRIQYSWNKNTILMKATFSPFVRMFLFIALKNWQRTFHHSCLDWRSLLGRIHRECGVLCSADSAPFLGLFSISGGATLVPCRTELMLLQFHSCFSQYCRELLILQAGWCGQQKFVFVCFGGAKTSIKMLIDLDVLKMEDLPKFWSFMGQILDLCVHFQSLPSYLHMNSLLPVLVCLNFLSIWIQFVVPQPELQGIWRPSMADICKDKGWTVIDIIVALGMTQRKVYG